MRVSAAELTVSAAHSSQFPKEGLPQIALCGRSNVGKSSLLNALVQRRSLARTSNTPGKTRQLNFYRIVPETAPRRVFYFVDLPGYGYAKVSQAERESWRRLIESYFQHAKTLRAAFSIIDSRIGAMESDLELLLWLTSLQLPVTLIATKADKLSNKERAEMQRQITSAVAHLPLQDVLMFSSQSALGSKELWKHVNEIVG